MPVSSFIAACAILKIMLFSQSSLFDIQEIQAYLILGVRILLAIGAGLVGWYLVPPLVVIAHRLIARKAASRYVLGLSRIGGAVLFGLLAFFLFSFLGFGGLGTGGSGGFGWGTGPGIGSGGSAQNKDDEQATLQGKTGQQEKKAQHKETLTIEMIPSEDYPGSGKYYLIEKKQPLRTIDEIRELLHTNKNKWDRMEIIIYANSPAENHRAVQKLRELAQQYNLAVSIPPEYLTRIKGAAKNDKE